MSIIPSPIIAAVDLDRWLARVNRYSNYTTFGGTRFVWRDKRSKAMRFFESDGAFGKLRPLSPATARRCLNDFTWPTMTSLENVGCKQTVQQAFAMIARVTVEFVRPGMTLIRTK